MAFWSETSSSPLRNYRFKVSGLLKDVWLVKSATMPSFEVAKGEFQVLNHKYKVAGVLSWQDITITTVAQGDTLKQINDLMKASGHALASPIVPDSKGIVNSFKGTLQNKIIINLLDKDGKSTSGFEIRDWFISNVTFSTLDYSDDELFNIEISIAYEYAMVI